MSRQSLISHTPTAPTSSSTPARSSSFFSFRSRSSVSASPPNRLQRASMNNHQPSPQQHAPPQRSMSVSQTQPQNTPPPPQQQNTQPPEQNPTPQPQQSHDQQSSAAHDASLHPEIRSIVSLTVAQTQKIYFSGPLVHKFDRNPDGQKPREDGGWRDVWAQLYGTTLSIWDMGEVKIANQQGKEVPPSYVNITEAVGSPLHLYHLRDSTKPPSPVRSCPRCYNPACDTDVSPSQIHQCRHSQHRRNESPPFLLSHHPGSHFMGCRFPTLVLGEIAPRGDIYGPSHPHCPKRWQERPFDPFSWQNGRLGQG